MLLQSILHDEVITQLFVMLWQAQTNGGIVRRTWGLFENADLRLGLGRYGPEFSYKEVLSRPGPPLSGHHFFATVFGVCGRWYAALLHRLCSWQFRANIDC